MKEISIPISDFGDDDQAEIDIRVGGEKISFQFRIASFLWDTHEDISFNDDEVSRSLARISRLKKSIEKYDKEWELIQIFTPSENSNTIQVLYRKKMQK